MNNVDYICLCLLWLAERGCHANRGRTAAGDKHDSAEDVPAAGRAPSWAVQTPTAGCDRRCEAVDLNVRLCETTRVQESQTDEKTRLYLSHFYKRGTGWAHSIEAKIGAVLLASVYKHAHARTHTILTHTQDAHLHWQNAATHFQGKDTEATIRQLL